MHMDTHNVDQMNGEEKLKIVKERKKTKNVREE